MRKLEVPFSIMNYIQKFFSYKKNRVQLCLKLNISKTKHEVVEMSATWHGTTSQKWYPTKMASPKNGVSQLNYCFSEVLPTPC